VEQGAAVSAAWQRAFAVEPESKTDIQDQRNIASVTRKKNCPRRVGISEQLTRSED